MNLPYRLLEHPFYRAWQAGTITTAQLAAYGQAYLEFVERMPTWWERALTQLESMDTAGKAIIADELAHVELWKNWLQQLDSCATYPRLTELIAGFDALQGAALLGALQAFEIQMPAVAKTKKAGLQQHYGQTEGLAYFDQHMEHEDAHIAYGKRLRDSLPELSAYNAGFETGARLTYHALDVFIN